MLIVSFIDFIIYNIMCDMYNILPIILEDFIEYTPM